jgi:hypothetical protein
MKNIYTFTILFTLLFSSFILLPSQAQKLPGIQFRETSHDFGEVIEQTYPTCYFVFKNTGNAALFLTKVMAGCGCTSPSWSRDSIMPGDTGFIKVVFNAQGYAGRDFYKSVSVSSNVMEGGKEKLDVLTIKGKVVSKPKEPAQYPIIFVEIYHDFGKIQKGKSAKWQAVIRNDGDSTVTIKSVSAVCNECFKLKVNPTIIPPKSSATLDITYMTKTLQPKIFSETIKVVTSLPEATTKKLSFYGIALTGEIIGK